MLDDNVFVTPGERIATEEEFTSGNNTYVENGVIYSAVIGKVVRGEGSVGVAASGQGDKDNRKGHACHRGSD